MAKWEVGPVRQLDGCEAHIDFIQHECNYYHYIGRQKEPDGVWKAASWASDGRVPYATSLEYRKNLVPPPEKAKVRVHGYLNVYANGAASFWIEKEMADAQRLPLVDRFACILIDREVEEGEGLS